MRRHPVVQFVAVAVLAGAVLAAGLLPLVGTAALAATAAVRGFESLPQRVVAPDLPQSSVLLARDGSTLATLYAQNRLTVPLSEIAPVMQQAILAVEDSRFYEHKGVDLQGTTRAILATYLGDGDVQGGSTITQQYVKNILVETARTPQEADAARAVTATRKLREMRLALGIERRLTKDQILEGYLNIAFFGNKAYGVETAARRYFNKSAKELTLAEASTLAGIVQSPAQWDPIGKPENAQKRRSVVLNRMVSEGYITQEEAASAKATPISDLLNPTSADNGCVTSIAPFFCDYVLQVIINDAMFGKTKEAREALLRQGGLIIQTTLDPKAQLSANNSVRTWIPPTDPSNKAAAITMLEPGTGEIRAMAQNRDWGPTSEDGKTALNYNVGRQFNGIIGAQAGSTFKAFTIAAALEQGFSPWEPIASPNNKTFTGFVNCETNTPFEPYTVQNSTASGTFDMFRGTAFSVNTYFVGLEEKIGLCGPVAMAKAAGVVQGDGKDIESVPSFTLGVAPVTTMTMAEAYATFAAHGVHCSPRAITKITNRAGQDLKVRERTCRRVMDRAVADGVTVMLRGVIDGNIEGRTGARMSLGRDAAGKTGTINENAAVWFVGYTPDLSAAVWVGDPRGGQKYPMQNVTINGKTYKRVFGGTIPGPIWKESMLGALKDSAPIPFALQPDLQPVTTPKPETTATHTNTPTPTVTITVR